MLETSGDFQLYGGEIIKMPLGNAAWNMMCLSYLLEDSSAGNSLVVCI